jgi:hypothetical protein
MPLPTLDNYLDNDEDPSLDTSGFKEDAILDDDPDASVATKKPAAKAEPAPAVTKTPAVDAEPVVLKEPGAEEPQAADAAPEKDPYIPEVNRDFFKYPEGKPVQQSFDERRVDVMDPDGVMNTVDHVSDEEAFKREAEAHLAISQGKEDANYPDWINKPDVWPLFIGFPSKRDMQAIERAESEGKLDDERKAKFNEHFEKLSILMQQRARQMDAWMTAENEEIMLGEKKKYGVFRSYVNRDIHKLRKDREKLEAEREQAIKDGKLPPETASDPFYDVKWAVLLDPYASPDDPRFADVARWGHSTTIMQDGGALCADDDGLRVPKGNEGSVMAGKMAVMEALERGWSTIEISGSEEFVKGAREAAIQAGMGAKITTRYGLLGRSKPEYIMPKPPKMAGMTTAKEETASAHEDLLAGEGKAPADGKEEHLDSPKPPRKLTRPGEEETPEAQDLVESPFDGDTDEADAEALKRLKAEEDDVSPS